ncbi:MAG: hypothetical protein NUV80_03820 [Candidatus Berkelbacteria bacterium]|nr:hypothetical protein [Candidatus Berkelbacteria bacterium]
MRLGVYILLCASLIAIGWFARGERIQKQIVYVQKEQAKEVEKVEKKKAEREIVYVDRLKVIHDTQDNCLDQPIPIGILSILRPAAAQSGLDEGLRLSAASGGDLP